MFWISWFLFGLAVSGYVFALSPRDRNKWFLLPFYTAIVLAGPLVLLLIIIPREDCQRMATAVRDWLEKLNSTSGGA